MKDKKYESFLIDTGEEGIDDIIAKFLYYVGVPILCLHLVWNYF